MRKSMKRMVLTGAAVMVLVSGLSAPAMASPVLGELKDADPQRSTPSAPSLPKSPNGPGSGIDVTGGLEDANRESSISKLPIPAPDPGTTTPDPTPKQPDPTTPKQPDPTTPKQPDPTTPKQPDPGKEGKDKEGKDKEDKDKEDRCPGLLERELCRDGTGNNSNNNSNSSSSSSSSSSGSSSSSVINSYYDDSYYYGGILDRGGVFVSNFLPYEFTSVVEDAGYSLKSYLPAPVAKTLPNTGGGWTFLALAGGALLLTGRFLIRRFSS